jgi:MraZ protein
VATFLSTFHNKIDKKGRVSVPSQFRNALAKEDFSGVIAYPSFIYPCVEACGMSRIEKISDSIDRMDPYSEERDAFAVSILGDSVQLSFDKEGRVILGDSLIEQAALNDHAVFVGKGKTFEIWNPDKYQDYLQKSREIAKANRGKLSLTENTQAS